MCCCCCLHAGCVGACRQWQQQVITNWQSSHAPTGAHVWYVNCTFRCCWHDFFTILTPMLCCWRDLFSWWSHSSLAVTQLFLLLRAFFLLADTKYVFLLTRFCCFWQEHVDIWINSQTWKSSICKHGIITTCNLPLELYSLPHVFLFYPGLHVWRYSLAFPLLPQSVGVLWGLVYFSPYTLPRTGTLRACQVSSTLGPDPELLYFHQIIHR